MEGADLNAPRPSAFRTEVFAVASCAKLDAQTARPNTVGASNEEREMPDLQQLAAILPVMVSYTVPYPGMDSNPEGWECIKVALRSFHEHFPDRKVLVVDNDSDDPANDPKRAWLHAYPGAIVLRNPLTRNAEFWEAHHPRRHQHHGNGIDCGVDHCRRHGVPYMLHFEPDCIVSGTSWLEAMWQCIAEGAWMAGINCCNHSREIIHVCPSLWTVDTPACEPSFARQPIEDDRKHPRFEELTRFSGTARTWDRWDMGQKNWWVAALAGRARWAQPVRDDFEHYGAGSGYAGLSTVRERVGYERIKKYL